MVDPAGATTSFGYDAGNQPTMVGYSDAKTAPVTLTYTPAGLRASMVDGSGTTSYSYDGLNRLTAQSNGAGQGTGYGYDLAGHLTALTYPNGKNVTRGYDAAGRLTALTDWTGHTTTLTPDAEGNTATATYGNAVTAAMTYDPSGAMSATTDKSPAGVTLASLAYTRDANSQLTSATPTGLPGAGESYSRLTYDARGDRTAGSVTGGATGSYTYDQAPFVESRTQPVHKRTVDGTQPPLPSTTIPEQYQRFTRLSTTQTMTSQLSGPAVRRASAGPRKQPSDDACPALRFGCRGGADGIDDGVGVRHGYDHTDLHRDH